MSDYTITIRAEDSETETVIGVSMDGSTPRVVELTMRAGSGISAPSLPAFDLNLLLRALFPAGAPPAADTAVDTDEPDATPAPTPATAVKRAVRSGITRGGGADNTRTRRTEVTVPKGRVYRRMPDDVVEVFNRTGTVTAVAEHYGVPRHTAQGWIGRLRRSGGFTVTS